MVFRDFLCGSLSPKAKTSEEQSNLPWKSPSIASTKPSKRSWVKRFFSGIRKSKKTPYLTEELVTRRERQNIIYNMEVPVVAKKQPEEPDNLVILNCDSPHNLQLEERRVELLDGFGKVRSFSSSKKMEPYWYLAAALVLILLLVDSFGKPVAVICCSVFWHLVPALRGKELKANE